MVYIFVAMIFYSLAILLGAAASRGTNPTFAAGVTNVISALIPVFISIPLMNKKIWVSDRVGILLAVLCGVAIAVFVIALNKSYAVNKVGIVAPIVFGGALVLSTILSTVVFKEKMTPLETVGIGLLTVGLIVLTYARSVGR